MKQPLLVLNSEERICLIGAIKQFRQDTQSYQEPPVAEGKVRIISTNFIVQSCDSILNALENPAASQIRGEFVGFDNFNAIDALYCETALEYVHGIITEIPVGRKIIALSEGIKQLHYWQNAEKNSKRLVPPVMKQKGIKR